MEKIGYLTYIQFYYNCKFSSLEAILFLILIFGMWEFAWLIFALSGLGLFSFIFTGIFFFLVNIEKFQKMLYQASDLLPKQEYTFFFKSDLSHRPFERYEVSRVGHRGHVNRTHLKQGQHAWVVWEAKGTAFWRHYIQDSNTKTTLPLAN